MERELLADIACLIGVRWSMDMQTLTIDNKLCVYGVNTRFTVSLDTLIKALGNAIDHVHLQRGGPGADADQLMRYYQAKRKWKVEERVTESTSGWAESERPGTSQPPKLRRY